MNAGSSESTNRCPAGWVSVKAGATRPFIQTSARGWTCFPLGKETGFPTLESIDQTHRGVNRPAPASPSAASPSPWTRTTPSGPSSLASTPASPRSARHDPQPHEAPRPSPAPAPVSPGATDPALPRSSLPRPRSPLRRFSGFVRAWDSPVKGGAGSGRWANGKPSSGTQRLHFLQLSPLLNAS